jgi:hypothetical protein
MQQHPEPKAVRHFSLLDGLMIDDRKYGLHSLVEYVPCNPAMDDGNVGDLYGGQAGAHVSVSCFAARRCRC